MNQFKRSLTGILNGLAGISFLTMVMLTCWQVFTRYILKNPSTWSEELVSYLFAWASLLGAVLVTREKGHMNIPILIDACGEAWQKALNCLCELVGFIFSAVILVYGGIRISSLAMGQMTSSLGVAVGIFYVILPLAGILNMIYTLLNMAAIFGFGEDTSAPAQPALSQSALSQPGSNQSASFQAETKQPGSEQPDAGSTERKVD